MRAASVTRSVSVCPAIAAKQGTVRPTSELGARVLWALATDIRPASGLATPIQLLNHPRSARLSIRKSGRSTRFAIPDGVRAGNHLESRIVLGAARLSARHALGVVLAPWTA